MLLLLSLASTAVLAGVIWGLLIRDALLREYIALLRAELRELIPFAFPHGWKSTRHEEGKRLRARLGLKGDGE